MPMNYSLFIEPFDVWGFDYMGPFPSSNGYTHILVAADYILSGYTTKKRHIRDILGRTNFFLSYL